MMPMTDRVKLIIDDIEVAVAAGTTVLEAAQSAGIYIPTLCYHPDLKPYGGCRLCIVEIEKMRGLPTACTTPAADGMVVRTDTPQLQELRRGFLHLILSEHPNACLTCDRRAKCSPYRRSCARVALGASFWASLSPPVLGHYDQDHAIEASPQPERHQ